MWTSICNFFCDKFFYKSELNSALSENESEECIYGKRLKLNSSESRPNGSVNKINSLRFSMQANGNISDDEDECCVIAEIPRRKRPENAVDNSRTLQLSIIETRKSNTNLSSPSQKGTLKKDDSREIEIVKGISCSSLSKFSKTETKSKFFRNQRVPFNRGKIIKNSTLFKNQLKRRLNFLQQSYRLTEKIQYMQLLQSHTSRNLTVVPSFNRLKCITQAIPVIDLTDEKAIEDNKTTTLCIREASKKVSEDQDVQIVREIPGVTSFQDILKIKPVNSNETIQEILSKRTRSSCKLLGVNKIVDDSVCILETNTNKQTCPDTLEEKLQNFMHISGVSTQEAVDNTEEHYCLPELTKEQEKKIHLALVPHPSSEILTKNFGLQITRRDMQTLLGLNWLNDEIINFYMNLLVERSKKNNTLPKVYSFNTFFYPKLMSSEYNSLRRWTKQVDIFSFDMVLVPIHLGMHWCMSMIDFRRKSVEYYDSIGAPNDACLDRLLLYLKAESLDKKNKVYSTKDWTKSNVQDIPQQMNGSDCGVFSCMFAEHLARDCSILFSQDDMPYFRKKMIIEILEGKLLT